MLYLPTFTIGIHHSCHVGKYTSPMDGMGEVRHMDAFRRDTGDLIRPMVQVSW